MKPILDWVLSVPALTRWGVTLVFAALVIALSITPGVARPGDNAFVWLIVSTPAPLQKLMHVVVYATLALLWMWTLASVESRAVRITLVILITVGLGAILEWHQTRVPGRFGTVFDVLLNIIGTLIGIIAAFLIM
jgi:hypothetical protein